MATPSTPQEETALVDKLSQVMRQQMAAGHTHERPHWNETAQGKLERSLRDKFVLAKFNGMTWEIAADIANYAAMLADNRAGS